MPVLGGVPQQSGTDQDVIRAKLPSPADDPYNLALGLRNLRPVARSYVEAGATRIVLAGVIETRIHRDLHQDALGMSLSVCRLRVDLPVIRARLAQRHDGEGAVLQRHLDRAGELDAILETAGAENFTVDATDLSIPQAAAAVIRAAGCAGNLRSP